MTLLIKLLTLDLTLIKIFGVSDQSSIHKVNIENDKYTLKSYPVSQDRDNPIRIISFHRNNMCKVGLQNGVVESLDLGSRSYSAPDLALTDIRLFYESFGDSIQSSMLTSNTQLPSFTHDQNHFGFSYLGRLPGVDEDLLYSYRLLGLDDSWSPPATMNTVNFANLAPGKMTFEVKAIHPYDYTLSSEIKRVSFCIESSIWKKRWFQLALGVLILSLGFLFLRNRINSIQKRNNDRERKLKLQNKLLDLERNALQLQMNPHFIFNALNTVKKQLRVHDVKRSEQILTKFSSLIRNTLEHSRQTSINLEDEIELLENYLSIEQLSRNHSFKYTIEQNVEDSFDISIPPMMLQPFIENAIQHGVAGRDNGQITITFHQRGKMIVCHIKDNGPGLKQPSESTHKSRAIQVTTDRLALLTDTRKDHLYINNIHR